MNLIERCAGNGRLLAEDRTLGRVAYRVDRYQGIALSGLPIPGLHRIEGAVDLANVPAARDLVGADLKLELEDGRTLRITLADETGRVLAEGHGPKRGCGCC